MNRTRVVKFTDDYDVYIGRRPRNPHHWGNPFHIGPDGTRDDVCHKFELWMEGVAYTDREPKRRAWMLENIDTLQGKALGCHCKPLRCHGDTLARLADTDDDMEGVE